MIRALTASVLGRLTGWLLVLQANSAFPLEADRYVQTAYQPGNFVLVQGATAAPICLDTNDYPGVLRAARDLQADIDRVTGLTPQIIDQNSPAATNIVMVGSIGKNQWIARLVREGKLDSARIVGKWESFLIQVVSDPGPGTARALVIAGSDKRGAIYGVYDLSEQVGVSPWYWWADVPPRRQPRTHSGLFVNPGPRVQGPPAVKYRGIFLNDEAPALTGWVREKFGNYNHRFYTNVFELILRLKGNFLWPAMWDNSFATDDPLNPKLADDFGIVVSTSHHEPMMRAWKEWERAGNRKGSWDYSKNSAQLLEFWRAGISRTKDFEKVITLGMRGDGDEPMSETESIALLERIVADQRRLISGIVETNLPAVPQVWALYKEVQGYYERGMRVPDDVTLLWCDDNWGDLRRLPTAEERRRGGGAGIYYHLDYVGGPRNYKWLNTVPIPKIQEQMNLAWRHGADRLWVVNVGDLKPVEFPMEFFLTFAWDPGQWPKERLADYTRLWAAREFGPNHAADIADIIAKYTMYNGRRKPELLDPDTFSLVHYREADRVLEDWQAIARKAEAISAALPENARAAFYELVLHPTKACAVVNELYLATGRNRLYARQGRAAANDWAARARQWFNQDAELSDYFNHKLLNGKWNHMMDQTHIGYTYWQQPPRNSLPRLADVEVPEPAHPAVAIEGSDSAWPGSTNAAVLPVMDVYNQPRRFVDVFNRGRTPFEVKLATDVPWLLLEPKAATVDKEQRFWIAVDWNKAPKASATGAVTIAGPGSAPIQVRVPVFNPDQPSRQTLKGFVESDGYVSIEAEHYTRKTDASISVAARAADGDAAGRGSTAPSLAAPADRTVRWERIPDLGRTLSSMAIFPVTAPSVTPPQASPCLEYQVYLFTTGRVEVTAMLGPCLNYDPARGVCLGLSLDDEPPRVLTVVPKGYSAGDGNRDWEESVKDSVRKVKSACVVSTAGYHAVKVWMVDPGVSLQKLVIDTGGLKPSYLGPPESFHVIP